MSDSNNEVEHTASRVLPLQVSTDMYGRINRVGVPDEFGEADLRLVGSLLDLFRPQLTLVPST